MSGLKPSVLGMLELGKECGLEDIHQAYQMFMSHYDCFFLISEFNEQNKVFTEEMVKFGLCFQRPEDDMYELHDLTIDEAIEKVNEYGKL